MIGRTEKYLLDRIERDGAIHITLIDPENATPEEASSLADVAESCHTTAIMVGGSTFFSTSHLDSVVKAIKKSVNIPIILFPNNITGISKYADAIWFMSLLNSSDPYFITGAQVLGSILVKKLGLEAIPLGYIIVGEASAASVIGRAHPIPYNKPELAAAYSLTAQYFGMRFAYLEAGSGAQRTVPLDMIRRVKDVTNIPIIVGGGIKTCEQVKKIVEAGAKIVVTGTIVEEAKERNRIRELIESAKTTGKGG